MCKLSFALGSNESLDQKNFHLSWRFFRSLGRAFLHVEIVVLILIIGGGPCVGRGRVYVRV